MKPYYEHGGITIFCGDCREILPHVKADVLVMDPPYGTNEHGGYGRRQLGLATIANDDDLAVRDGVLGLWPTGPAIVFGSPRRAEPPGEWDYRLVWDKLSPGLGAPWRWQHGEWVNRPGVPSVIACSAGNSLVDRWHPHEKPIRLMTAILAGLLGSVVDPTCGSGSSLITAKQLGRKAIGIEIEERYCEIAAKRLSQEVLPFGGANAG